MFGSHINFNTLVLSPCGTGGTRNGLGLGHPAHRARRAFGAWIGVIVVLAGWAVGAGRGIGGGVLARPGSGCD